MPKTPIDIGAMCRAAPDLFCEGTTQRVGWHAVHFIKPIEQPIPCKHELPSIKQQEFRTCT
ncbi:hypothetical protein BH10PSE16_BH10PSE16_01140 [soil metagenome]